MLFLYRGMSHGAVSVVVPVSAVSGVALPVLAAVAFLGERPSPLSWCGIAVAVPALSLVSTTRNGADPAAPAAIDGLLAGTGIAVQYLALAQAPAGSGLWPVAAGRLAACLAIAPLVAPARVPFRLPRRLSLAAAANGTVAAAALTLYLLAARQQLLAIAVVLSSLYPAIVAAAAAVALLTAG
jgi:drug/metabolite transporter (DMT)-like permease